MKILVVEDNAQVNELLCDMLELLDQQPRGVTNAELALPLLEGEAYDVLLTDVRLPGMSGIELARKALLKRAGLRIVFATGYANKMADYLEFDSLLLPKPYDIDQLRDLLSKL